MNKKRFTVMTAAITAACLGLGGLLFAENSDTKAQLTADFTKEKTEISENLFGIFYEDINYAADGGLYGELIQNRSFEFKKSHRGATESWKNANIKAKKQAKSKVKGKKDNPLNENNPTYAQIEVKRKWDGIENSGYNGIPLEAGKTYPLSLYLRSPDKKIKKAMIVIGSKEKKARLTKIKVKKITNEWQKFTFDVTPAESTENGFIGIYAGRWRGTLDIDFVSLFRADIYKNEENGLRQDLAQMLEDLHPAFVRFPGGCLVEGSRLSDRYQWKNTIGPVEERVEELNFWNYQQSMGIGFYEYFRLCEDIGAEPIPIINCGISFAGENNNEADVPMDQMDSYAQDALDLIEWATGPATSTWGKKRADQGHPQPFKLNYLGIGNENGREHYYERYKYIADKVREKYPDIKLIMSSGAFPSDDTFYNTWKQVRKWEADPSSETIVDLVDEHYYCPPAWFLSNTGRYDVSDFYPRGKGQPKVFVGEFASQVENKKGGTKKPSTLYAAVTAAAYMTSLERNGDIVEIASYAPLFARENNYQWSPDMIWFTNTQVYGTPDYYVQQLFMNNKADKTVAYQLTQPESDKEKAYIGGSIGLGSWSTTVEYKDITVTDKISGNITYNSKTSSDLSAFDSLSGAWDFKDGSIIGSSSSENCRLVMKGDGSQHYVLQLKAKKTGGNEGFLVMFGHKDGSFYWWNLGGWSNTKCCVEKGTAAARSVIGNTEAITIENGKWYDIKIEVNGESYKCYLDGNLIHDFTDVLNFSPIYAHVGESQNEIIVKLVNVSEEALDVDVNLKGCEGLAKDAKVIVISGNPDDENSYENPKLIAPVEEKLSEIGEKFTYRTKPTSVSVIKINKN
ncbi:MAG: hypothetical protein K5681_09515 [Treponema sp.]|nr:hypothetical protein [Treponema sp.]